MDSTDAQCDAYPGTVFVGFSGHRRLANATRASTWIENALNEIASRIRGRIAAVSSVASGADTLFAELVVARGLTWLLLLPVPIDEFKDDFTGDPEDWLRVAALLPRARRIRVEPRVEPRARAYLNCGHRTVDTCDVLIAFWDGREAAGAGGTADVVGYARSRGKPVTWIHALTGEIKLERMEKLPNRS
jgi:hypothetical protein